MGSMSAYVWRSTQSLVTPYMVEVETSGHSRAVGKATPYTPTEAQIAFDLAQFIGNVRSISLDPIIVRQNWLQAYAYTTARGAAFLNEYARANDPFTKKIGRAHV